MNCKRCDVLETDLREEEERIVKLSEEIARLRAALSDISLWSADCAGVDPKNRYEPWQTTLARIFDRADAILREGE